MWRDEGFLLDILIAARRVLRYVEGSSWEEFRDNSLVQDAVIRNLQVIGEAANRISEAFQTAHPEVPWRPVVGMRNRLVHEYARIDLEKVWETVRDDIPELVRLIEPLVPPEGQS